MNVTNFFENFVSASKKKKPRKRKDPSQEHHKKENLESDSTMQSEEGGRRGRERQKQKHSARDCLVPQASGIDHEQSGPSDSELIVGSFDQNGLPGSLRKKKKRKGRNSAGSQITDMDSSDAQGTAAASNESASGWAQVSDWDAVAGSHIDSAEDSIRENTSGMSPPKKKKKKKKVNKRTGMDRSSSQSCVAETESSYAEGSSLDADSLAPDLQQCSEMIGGSVNGGNSQFQTQETDVRSPRKKKKANTDRLAPGFKQLSEVITGSFDSDVYEFHTQETDIKSPGSGKKKKVSTNSLSPKKKKKANTGTLASEKKKKVNTESLAPGFQRLSEMITGSVDSDASESETQETDTRNPRKKKNRKHNQDSRELQGSGSGSSKEGAASHTSEPDDEDLSSALAELNQTLQSESGEVVGSVESTDEAEGSPHATAAGSKKKRQTTSEKASSSKSPKAEKLQRREDASRVHSPGKTNKEKVFKSVEYIGSDDSFSRSVEWPSYGISESGTDGVLHSSSSTGKKSVATACYLCDEGMPGREAYIAHLAQDHEKLSYQCRKCNMGLSSAVLLKCHLKVCKFQGSVDMSTPFRCPLCPLSYSYQKSLQRHKQVEHKLGKAVHAQCRHCQREFTTSFRAKKHMEKCVEGLADRLPTHGNLSCAQCGKLYSSKQSLSYHMRTIHQEHLFDCLCGKQFRGSTYYYAHVKLCPVSG